MPIYVDKTKQVSIVQIGKTVMSYVYVHANIVWQSIRSCFGSGAWINSKPWLNNESWKNN